MVPHKMHLVVAMVGYRNAQDILACLQALSVSTYSDFEILICENGGEEAFRQLRAVLPSRLSGGQVVRAFQAKSNLGYAAGVNACLRAAPHAEAWWILNPDTEPSATAMALMAARLESGDCDAVGSSILGSQHDVQSHGGRWRPWLARAEAIGRGEPVRASPAAADVERIQNYISGASLMVTARFLQVVGPMREDYFLYGEEVEWCLRGVQRGMRLGFAAGARVLHHAGTTTGSAKGVRSRPRLPVYLDERNKILVTRDRFPARLPVAAGAAFLLILMRFARRGAWRQTGYALAGWFDGLRNRRGKPEWVTN
jgi:Predicted glycosyltransferases